MAQSRGRLTKSGFIAVWILGGIGRQIKLDTKRGALNARDVFHAWMRTKWQRTSAWIRVPLFAIGVTARTAYRFGVYSDRTLGYGIQAGAIEGIHRHQESLELRDMQRDYPRNHPHYTERLEQVRADRLARRDAHEKAAHHWWEATQTARVEKRDNAAVQRKAQADMNAAWGVDNKKWHAAHDRLLAARHDALATPRTAPPAGPILPAPTTPAPAPQSAGIDPLIGPTIPPGNGSGPAHPGEPIGLGHWRMRANGLGVARWNLTRSHAEKLAAWQRWRNTQPGGQIGDVAVLPMGDRLDYFRGPDGELRFGATLDDPNGIKECGHCGGTALAAGGICPSCQARGDIRFNDHQRRKAATNGHAIPVPVIPSSVNKPNSTTNNGGAPMSQTVNAEAGSSIPRLHAAYQSTTEGLATSGEQATSRAELATSRAAAFESLSASYMDISGQLSAHGHDPIDVNAAADVADQLRVLAERQTAIAALESDLAGSFMDSSAQVAQALEESQTRNAAALEAAGMTKSNAPLNQYRE